jgi:hypothetical protein
MDNILKVNLVNFLTVGLMAFIFVWLVNWGAAKYAPALAIGPATSKA